MLLTKFGGNWPPVPEKIFEGFTIYGCRGHLGHVISIMSSDFHLLVPESFHSKFGLNKLIRPHTDKAFPSLKCLFRSLK